MTAEVQIDHKTLAKTYAERIVAGECLNEQEEVGASLAIELAQQLRANGFEDYENHSRCKVASAEYHVRKDGMYVDIASSFFLGVFTIIRAYKSVR
jgi:hypothetical protein